MNRELQQQLMEYTINDDIDLLFRAIMNEVAYQYDDIKYNYTDFDNTDFTLDDLEEVTKSVLATTYMIEGLNELIQNKLYDYVKRCNNNV